MKDSVSVDLASWRRCSVAIGMVMMGDWGMGVIESWRNSGEGEYLRCF